MFSRRLKPATTLPARKTSRHTFQRLGHKDGPQKLRFARAYYAAYTIGLQSCTTWCSEAGVWSGRPLETPQAGMTLQSPLLNKTSIVCPKSCQVTNWCKGSTIWRVGILVAIPVPQRRPQAHGIRKGPALFVGVRRKPTPGKGFPEKADPIRQCQHDLRCLRKDLGFRTAGCRLVSCLFPSSGA